MSSFIAHSLAALSVYTSETKPALPSIQKFWLIWLIIIASAPDIDYIFAALRVMTNSGERIRVTHSLVFSLILPIATFLVLIILGYRENILNNLSKQAFIAAFSHLALDSLVGVSRLPLLWPFSTQSFKVAFGILPSAGKLNIFNYFLYRNTFIEIGILVPLVYCTYLISHKFSASRIQKVRIVGLLLISICFIFWSVSLNR